MKLDNKSRKKPVQVTTTTRVSGRKEETVYTISLHFHLKYRAAPGPRVRINPPTGYSYSSPKKMRLRS